MTKTAVAGDDRDRELAALRAELAALRQEVAMLRAVKLGSDAPPGWQQVYPGTVVRPAPWLAPGMCAGAAAPVTQQVMLNAGCASPAVFSQLDRARLTAGCAAGYAGQVFTIPAGWETDGRG